MYICAIYDYGQGGFLWRYLYKEIPRSCLWLEVAECYYVLEPDTAKDASTEATILCKALDDANEILRQRSTTMPGNIILEVEWVPKCSRHVYKVLPKCCTWFVAQLTLLAFCL